MSKPSNFVGNLLVMIAITIALTAFLCDANIRRIIIIYLAISFVIGAITVIFMEWSK